MSGINLSFVRYADLATIIGQVARPADLRCVVGVPRSGMIPATMLATRWNVPMAMCGGSVAGGDRIGGDGDIPGEGVLLVDDSVLTGNSMRRAKARLIEQGIPASEITTFAPFVAPDAEGEVDHVVYRLSPPRLFEWNIWNNVLTWNIAFDMDGVLCFDPERFDDDGPEYEAALRDAVPRFLPRQEVGAIVTNRLERWREVTMDWLERHGVSYRKLVMQPYDTAAERRASSDPASFKSAYYGDSSHWLFVESHDAIGRGIAQKTRRPVWSLESGSIFKEAG